MDYYEKIGWATGVPLVLSSLLGNSYLDEIDKIMTFLKETVAGSTSGSLIS